MNIQSLNSYSKYLYLKEPLISEPITTPKTKIERLDKPNFLDRYFVGSGIASLFFASCPFHLRVAANVCSSILFRGADCYLNHKSFRDFFSLDLISHIGATVLLGEIEAKVYRIAKGSLPLYRIRTNPLDPRMEKFALSTYDEKLDVIKKAYYDKDAFDYLMVALKRPSDFNFEHKSLVMNELKCVLEAFHPERAAVLNTNLNKIALNFGNMFEKNYFKEHSLRVKDLLELNYDDLYLVKDSPEFSNILETIFKIGLS